MIATFLTIRGLLLGLCECQSSHCFCGCSYYGDYPETTMAARRGPIRPKKHQVWAVCRLTVAGLQENLGRYLRVQSSYLSRFCSEDSVGKNKKSLITIIWLPRSPLGGGLQERPISNRPLTCFDHTSTHLQGEKRQKLEIGAITG